MDINSIIGQIEDMDLEMQSNIGTDEAVHNEYADGYHDAILDVLNLLRKELL